MLSHNPLCSREQIPQLSVLWGNPEPLYININLIHINLKAKSIFYPSTVILWSSYFCSNFQNLILLYLLSPSTHELYSYFKSICVHVSALLSEPKRANHLELELHAAVICQAWVGPWQNVLLTLNRLPVPTSFISCIFYWLELLFLKFNGLQSSIRLSCTSQRKSETPAVLTCIL